MSNPSTLPVAAGSVRNQPRKARYFFVAMALLFPIVVWLGFFASYREMNAGTLEVHWFTHFHGAVMTSWIGVFLAQAFLAAKGRLQFHRRLGRLSVVLGVLVFLTMGAVSIRLLLVNHPPQGSFLFDLLLTEIKEMACFGLFFIWGIRTRTKDTASHKRLLTLATFVLLTAAVDRLQRAYSFPSLGMEYPAYSFFYLDTLLIPLFVYDWLTIRRIHRITRIGTAVVMLLQIAVSNLYGSPAWHKFWFELTAPLMEKMVEVTLSDIQSDPLLGDYEGPIGRLTISRDKGRLYLQFDGQEKQALAAGSETELFLKKESLQLQVVKGPDGVVTQITLKQIGRIYKMVKLKRR